MVKINFIVPILCICLLAILVADQIYQKYLETTIEYQGNVYFIQQGVYTDKTSIENIPVTSISDKNYIVVEDQNKYYTYLGMTLSEKMANKIKNFYEKKDIPVYVKSVNITNQEFLNELGQYDILLENTDDVNQIENILETILSTYEETLKNN